MTVINCLDWVVEQLLPAFFVKMDSLLIGNGVSILGFSVGITVLCVVIGAIVLRV